VPVPGEGSSNVAGVGSSGSGDVSDDTSSSGSSHGAAAEGTNSETASSAADSSSQLEFSHLGIWLSLLFVMLTLTPVAIWTVIKTSRENDDTTGSNEVPYQKLDTQQILGKIIKR
jgi:hypothetical protein